MQIKKYPLIVIFCLLFAVMLINLNKIPIAWVDEVMMIEPAWNYLQEGKFIGKMWPHEGSEKIFLAYLPLNSFIHLIDLSIFPPEIFFTRLLWLAFLGIACYYLYQYLSARYMLLPAGILLLTCIFIMDEGINNSLRNGRIELPSIALVSALFYLSFKRKRPSIQAFLISLLLISHPGFYPIALVLIIDLLSRKASIPKRIQYVLLISIFPLFYLYMSGFNFQLIYEQLVLHGKEHDHTAVEGNPFYLHFVQRFLPVYKFQPYMILLNLLLHAYCIYVIIMRWNPRQQIIEWAFLLTSVFWFFTLAPFYRYTSMLTFMMFLLLPGLLQRVFSVMGYLRISFRAMNTKQFIFIVLFLAYCSIPFVLRHSAAFYQIKERNEYGVYAWLDVNLNPEKNEKILIIDEAIGFYYSMQHPLVSFTLPYSLHKVKLEDYQKVYYLSFRESPEKSILINEYKPGKNKLPSFIPGQITTYDGLKLYEVKDQDALMELRRN